MGSFVFWLLRPVLKALLWAAALYVVAFLPAFVYTHFHPGSEHTQRPLLYAMVGTWNTLLVGGLVYTRFLRGRLGGGGLAPHAARVRRPRHRAMGGNGRALLTGTPAEFAALLDDMLTSGGLVRRAAARLRQKADRERSGVISSAQSHTHFLDSPRMARVLGSSSLNLGELKRGRLSGYLVLPPDRLDAYRRWLRVMIACALRAVTRTPGRPRERVLFLLDEFAHLGPMAPVTRAVSLLAGYGASLWLFLQDLAQLRAVYPDAWGTYLANADVLQAFGTADQFTAELLSKMTGQATVHVESLNRSAGRSTGDLKPLGQSQHGAGATLAEAGRPLLFPDEVRRLNGEQQLVFVKGAAPLLADRVSCLDDREFAGCYLANPMHQAARSLIR